MSRMIFGSVLGLAMAAAAGCGSKPEPSQPAPAEPAPAKEPDAAPKADTPKADSPKSDAAKGEAPKAEPPKVAWEMDPEKHAIPAGPVTGTLGGSAFAPAAVLEGSELRFRMGKPGDPNPEREVTITLPPPAEGRTFKVSPDQPNAPELPRIFAQFPAAGPGQPGGALFPGSHAFYALTLELGARKDGKVPGRIYLAMRDEAKSAFAGTFTAEYVRPPAEPPGADDRPFVAGEVSAAGGRPAAEVRVGYVGLLADGTYPVKELTMPADEQPRSVRDDNDPPRTSALVAGDGKGRPFRYEHLKLPPGRYLLSAAVKGGPAAWKWVEVTAATGLTENVALDPAKAGGLEIAVPAGAPGKVAVVPADDPARPPLTAEQFAVFAVLARIDVEVVAGKAVVRNLGPGRYEVRLGDERRVVEVVAGKTAEVNLAPPKK